MKSLPGQLSCKICPVHHDLLVSLTPGSNPAIVHAETLDVVGVVFHAVHLHPRLPVPGPQSTVQTSREDDTVVKNRDTLSSVLMTLENSEKFEDKISLIYSLVSNLSSSRLAREKMAISG